AETIVPPVAVAPPPLEAIPPPPAVPEPFAIETATEQLILDHVAGDATRDLTIFRLKANPRIVVLDFRSLRSQGRMLNRAAAQVGANENVTRRARATILRHELSHGEYFTNPVYAAFVHRFWTQTLTPGERDRIRRYLQSQGYDSGLEDVMENEAQAYLMFTD